MNQMARFFLTQMIEKHSQTSGAIALAAISVVAVAARASEAPLESANSRSRFLMGTVCEVVVDGDPSIADAAFAEISRVESLISTWNDASELSRLNRTARAVVSEELFALLLESTRRARATGGAFNPLVGPLVDLWRTRVDGTVPAGDALELVRPLLSLDGPRFDVASRSVSLPKGAAFEEGGFGKGYALDRAAAVLESASASDFIIDFGGQLMIRSQRPVDVAIASPARRDEIALHLRLSSGSLSTSSGSENTFVVGVERFTHILDPGSGRELPARGSVSVVSSSATEADILSTALYVMGPREGLEWADQHEVSAIFIIPAGDGWDVLLSRKATDPGLAVRAARAEFKKEESKR